MRSMLNGAFAVTLGALALAGQASAQTPYQLETSGAFGDLPAGYQYLHIEAWVPAGGTHGAPYVVARPLNSARDRGLFVGTENGGAVTFGPYISAPSLWNYETGDDPDAFSGVYDLQRMSDGSPILIGGSTSSRTINSANEATTWQLSVDGTQLIPTPYGFISGAAANTSNHFGGTPGEGYAGSDSTRPSIITAPGNGQHLENGGPFNSGIALDLNGGLAVGDVEFSATYWARQFDNTWLRMAPELPVWSDGTGTITEVAGGLMGGFLYRPDIDDAVPVL